MRSDLVDRKRALRAELRERRKVMTSAARDAATEGLTRELIALVERSGATTIACYLSSSSEPQTRPFLRWAKSASRRVLLPVSREDGLLDWAADSGTERLGLRGMPEPDGELLGPAAIAEADLILLPAAAVDVRGMRLGWGLGYYDRTLGQLEATPPAYAVLFDHEVLDEIPSEAHDQPVDGAATPSGLHRFPSKPL